MFINQQCGHPERAQAHYPFPVVILVWGGHLVVFMGLVISANKFACCVSMIRESTIIRCAFRKKPTPQKNASKCWVRESSPSLSHVCAPMWAFHECVVPSPLFPFIPSFASCCPHWQRRARRGHVARVNRPSRVANFAS